MPFGKFMLFSRGVLEKATEGIWEGWGKYPYQSEFPSRITNFIDNYEPPERIIEWRDSKGNVVESPA